MAASIDEMVTILDDISTLAGSANPARRCSRSISARWSNRLQSEFEGASFRRPSSGFVGQVRPVLLRRALRNLIGNAITYGKQRISR